MIQKISEIKEHKKDKFFDTEPLPDKSTKNHDSQIYKVEGLEAEAS